MGPIVIQTERLNLRAWTNKDRTDFALIAHEPAIMLWLNDGEPMSADQIDDFITQQGDNQRELGWCRWALELRDPAEGDPHGIVGACGFGCTLAPHVELGWAIIPQLWRRGLATEAGRAALRYGFDVVGFTQVYSAILPENAASRAVADKCGFVLDGIYLDEGEPTVRYVAHNPHPELEVAQQFVRGCPRKARSRGR